MDEIHFFTEERIFELTKMKVLVVGDLMLDEYVQGKVERTSPEAPVMVVKQESDHYMLGGAGNVAANLAEFGCRTALAGVVGRDEEGRKLKQILKERGITSTAVVVDSFRPTTLKTRIMSAKQQLVRVDREVETPVPARATGKMLEWIKKNLSRFNGLIISDYDKGALPPNFLKALIACAARADVPVLVDPKGRDFGKYHGATAIKPNLIEAHLATGITLDTRHAIERAVRMIAEKTACRVVVLTRGSQGLTLYDAVNRRMTHFPAISHGEVVDVGGAGDTFTVFFGLGLFAGRSFSEAAQLGNYACSTVVQKVGMATVSPMDLLRALFQARSAGKVRSLNELTTLADDLRRRSKRIVFTNGCFDLLHFGHIDFLEKAREAGDCLIVGLNSDRAIRKIKGKDRPYIGEAQRARLLAALSCVDYIVFFDQKTPEEVIRVVRPHVLAKGSNYREDEVVGREIVKRYKGVVKLIPIVDSISTAQLVNRIRGQK
jgi:D-beta-D-heptose 7-phosphate kinase/D-beta-D-heptose 1-phosphate adenosyltransferase